MIIVDYGFISNAINLTLKLTNISKKKAVHGIAFLAQAIYFLFQTWNEGDFHKTIHGKKVKFLTITKKRNQNEQILVEKLNHAIDKYFDKVKTHLVYLASCYHFPRFSCGNAWFLCACP